MRDLLKFYNNLDVKPFLEAVVNQREFFYKLNIDMFKDGMSLPGLAEKIMFSFEFQEFNDEFIHKKIPKEDYKPFTNWREKFKGYIQQDKDKERYDEEEFITYMDLSGLMNEQSNKCIYCWKSLNNSDWSLDRIDNKLGHNMNNCVLSCIHCNTTRKTTPYNKFYREQALIRYSKENALIFLIEEKNKDVFKLLKNNVVGGASIVFHRYHEADLTKIKRPIYENGLWKEGIEGETVKNITGFDANALYLWCIGQDMPCGNLKYEEYSGEVDLDFINNFC
jgi:hypothetical protein